MPNKARAEKPPEAFWVQLEPISVETHTSFTHPVLYISMSAHEQNLGPHNGAALSNTSRETGPDVVEIFGFHSRGHEHGVVCKNRAVIVAGVVSDGSRRSYCGLEISR